MATLQEESSRTQGRDFHPRQVGYRMNTPHGGGARSVFIELSAPPADFADVPVDAARGRGRSSPTTRSDGEHRILSGPNRHHDRAVGPNSNPCDHPRSSTGSRSDACRRQSLAAPS